VEFDQVSGEMNAALEDAQRQHPGVQLEAAFTRGYQRGRDYYQQRCDETGKAA
jgi:predicted secreted protein